MDSYIVLNALIHVESLLSFAMCHVVNFLPIHPSLLVLAVCRVVCSTSKNTLEMIPKTNEFIRLTLKMFR